MNPSARKSTRSHWLIGKMSRPNGIAHSSQGPERTSIVAILETPIFFCPVNTTQCTHRFLGDRVSPSSEASGLISASRGYINFHGRKKGEKREKREAEFAGIRAVLGCGSTVYSTVFSRILYCSFPKLERLVFYKLARNGNTHQSGYYYWPSKPFSFLNWAP